MSEEVVTTRSSYHKVTVLLPLLTAAYVACQFIADVTAVKMVELLGVVIPGGTFIYAVTFTVRDALHRRFGVKAANRAIFAAGVINVLMAAYFMLTIALPIPVWWEGQPAYRAVLGVVPGIVIASILAEVISELIDTTVYEVAWRTVFKNSHIGRVVLSNLISIPADSIIFAYLAFSVWPAFFGGHAMTGSEIMAMVIGQSAFKFVVSMVAAPLTMAVNGGK